MKVACVAARVNIKVEQHNMEETYIVSNYSNVCICTWMKTNAMKEKFEEKLKNEMSGCQTTIVKKREMTINVI